MDKKMIKFRETNPDIRFSRLMSANVSFTPSVVSRCQVFGYKLPKMTTLTLNPPYPLLGCFIYTMKAYHPKDRGKMMSVMSAMSVL